MTESEIKINRGLKGVYFERSGVSRIDGTAGELEYRGYSIHDLAQHSTFEETACLLLQGDLPTAGELSAFKTRLAEGYALPGVIYDIINATKDQHPMQVLRTAVSALEGVTEGAEDRTAPGMTDLTLKLTAQVPMIVAAHERIRNGLAPVDPDPSLSLAANWLRMLKGEDPSEDAARLADIDFILHAEHGSNASAFTARVVIGTEATVHAAMVAGIAALSGPAHGGAAEDVMKMAMEIGSPENAAAYVKAKRKAREPVTGFGHRVYRAEDPRARHMRAGVEQLSREMGQPEWYEILQATVEAMSPYARHGVNVNVDFYSGVIYHLHGIPTDLFVPIFTIGRVPGWGVQCIEQYARNILIRPLTQYDGPATRAYVPISER